MKDIKTIFLFLLAFITIGLLFVSEINFHSIATDSGFDTSYDSGGSSGGYSGGSSSSGFDSSYSSGGSGDFTLGDMVVIVGILFIVVVLAIVESYVRKYLEKKHMANRVNFILNGTFLFLFVTFFAAMFIVVVLTLSGILRVLCFLFVIFCWLLAIVGIFKQLLNVYGKKIKIEKIDTKISKMKKMVRREPLEKRLSDQKVLQDGYQVYLDIQEAWMNFDYDKLRTLVTDELFNMYQTQLAPMELKGQRNVMKDFKLESYYLISKKEENNITTIEMLLEVAFLDYIINKDEKVIRGQKNRKVIMTYLLTFVSSEYKVEKCPHCGAKIDNGETVCIYCKSVIQSVGQKMKLAKKEALRQSLE